MRIHEDHTIFHHTASMSEHTLNLRLAAAHPPVRALQASARRPCTSKQPAAHPSGRSIWSSLSMYNLLHFEICSCCKLTLLMAHDRCVFKRQWWWCCSTHSSAWCRTTRLECRRRHPSRPGPSSTPHTHTPDQDDLGPFILENNSDAAYQSSTSATNFFFFFTNSI